ncbi:tRNA uracil 4-sulfurtransferase ThiI [Paenibacillus apiarius]|uniref:Probable tRNA sulfurtransferase n=1 Tax=Paenibacillus apiarius TaxID=46240 RepID=A0ABT4DL76_9BACL|nr:tRNA uracil 4-sulfurtransferase ThiI [Paenibacillus apiarius]MCY9513558.1 tRNA 4-thiouridine(8) synthase ThiI [Paenibacillus apiarius]MCY9518109.1 tRNA 4-thiouridine(8) synthase ThiI [Paenibacillus apiarius]MCY9551490.1 tRNA 4-thiouridine(8) synthase ThiI [Paenibacillus apiarius]MCY9558644.1 tRNA 4-thiouridine(8) synthase ThiI [Paenibacillus apiarius]MCY9684042.1 tRNA 4-thiouridine(8) synthase ThiI [Paenibacillus apiarius]
MDYDMILLRYGEIAIKGKNRSRFEKAAYHHVKAVLAPFPRTKIIKEYGRLYVELNGEPFQDVIQVLKHIFGIVSLSPVKRAPSELEPIIETAKKLMQEMNPGPNTTFKVNARRAWKAFPHGSQELQHLVGAPVLREFPQLKVDVRQPEIELRVEVREEGTYLFSEVIKAAGGFPLASNGKAMLLLSGGIDSPVAGYQALRKGLEVEAIHFHSYPFTSERAKQKVLDLAQVLANYAGRIRVHLVPFTDIQTRLHQAGHENLLITLMRRAMLRISTQLAEERKAMALVTGDSLGQVASQTLGSMNVIGRASDLPLLRPLVAMDKDQIIRYAEQIGTYDLSILPYEDCCTLFVPKSPATNPNLKVVERVEQSIPELEQLIAAAVEGTEAIVLRAGGRPDDAIVINANKGKTEYKEQQGINHNNDVQEIDSVHGDWF